jgi:hypothetical protein
MALEKPIINTGAEMFRGDASIWKKNVFRCFECVSRVEKKKVKVTCQIHGIIKDKFEALLWTKEIFSFDFIILRLGY